MGHKKECVLTDRECKDCGECDICDLNPKKICDNCCVCIDKDADYKSIEIDEIVEDESMLTEAGEYDDWLFKEDYIVDYSEENDDKLPRSGGKRIKNNDN